jgi:hypothetical protein
MPEPMHDVHFDHRMREDDRVFIPDPAPVSMSHASGDVISLDSVRTSMVANFEQDDLDVPAFLRKRGDVM